MHPEFELSPDMVYLNNAAVAPWPIRSRKAVESFAAENSRHGARYYPKWLEVESQLRRSLAWLINAASESEIALVKNTSEALSLIAYGLPWENGDNVVSIGQEFPSNRVVWESLATRGVESRQLDLYASDSPEDDLIGLCDDKTRLISVSSVQYARGLALDLEKIGRFCRENAILFCVDAIQSLGAQPFDVQRIQADFVAADGHKWMLGPEGLGLFYVRDEIMHRLSLSQYGWHMVKDPGDYDKSEWQPAADARRFECGSPNMLAIHALNASLRLLRDIGMDEIHQRVQRNAQHCIKLIDHAGFELLSPRDEKRRAGIVTFAVPDTGPQQLYTKLMERGVICAPRGGGIRFSPHFFNSPEEIERAFAVIGEIM